MLDGDDYFGDKIACGLESERRNYNFKQSK